MSAEMMRMVHLNGYAPRRPGWRLRPLPCERDNVLTLIDLTEEDNSWEPSGETSAMISTSYQLDNSRIGIIGNGRVEKEDSYDRQPCSTRFEALALLIDPSLPSALVGTSL